MYRTDNRTIDDCMRHSNLAVYLGLLRKDQSTWLITRCYDIPANPSIDSQAT